MIHFFFLASLVHRTVDATCQSQHEAERRLANKGVVSPKLTPSSVFHLVESRIYLVNFLVKITMHSKRFLVVGGKWMREWRGYEG